MADKLEGDSKAGQVTFDQVVKPEDVVLKLYEGAYRDLLMKTVAETPAEKKDPLKDAPVPTSENKAKEVMDAAGRVLSPSIPLPDGWLLIPTMKGFMPSGFELKKKF